MKKNYIKINGIEDDVLQYWKKQDEEYKTEDLKIDVHSFLRIVGECTIAIASYILQFFLLCLHGCIKSSCYVIMLFSKDSNKEKAYKKS